MKVKRDGRTWKGVREQDGYLVYEKDFSFQIIGAQRAVLSGGHAHIHTNGQTDGQRILKRSLRA